MVLKSWLMRRCQLGLSGLLILVGTIACLGSDRTFAQVTADPSLGTLVTPNGTNLEIRGGTTVGETNLFHSFSSFSVKSGEGVDFRNASTINNILVRVTGGNPSNIQGLLRSQGKANLFVINPNGIVFGKDAQLSIGGSFIGTTANVIQFPGGGEFSINSPVNPLNPLLTVNPSAFLFNQIPTQLSSIQVNGASLSVREGQSLLLVGGDIKLVEQGELLAKSGRVELGGLAGVGTVGLNMDSNNFYLNFPLDVALANVSLSNLAVVSTTGESGGSIQVQGEHVQIADESEIKIINLFGSKAGGTLKVTASDQVELLGGSRLLTVTEDIGNAANIRIETGRLIVEDGSQISATTRNQGQGGTLYVTARDSIQLAGISAVGEPSGLFARTQATGNAGNIKIETGRLIVGNGSQISATTRNQGQGGTLYVTARDSIQLAGISAVGEPSGLFARTQATGNAGNLEIETGQLIVQDGARITASASGESTGLGGSITVKTGQLNVLNGAQVSVSSVGLGDAGSLTVNANSITLDQGKLIAETAFGKGGNITLQNLNLLLMRHGSQISSTAGTAQQLGDGGNITINAPNGLIVAVPKENSDIAANAFTGSGGTVQINASGIFGMTVRSREDLVRLLGTNEPAELNPQKLTTSDITAISQQSPTLNGQVTINTPDVDPSSGLVNLPTVPVNTNVTQGCTAGGPQAQSEFIITGRGGLPPNPSEALSTDAVQVDLVTLKPEVAQPSTRAVSTSRTSSAPPPIVEATGWVIDKYGYVVLTANAPTTPHSSWQTPTKCSAPKSSS